MLPHAPQKRKKIQFREIDRLFKGLVSIHSLILFNGLERNITREFRIENQTVRLANIHQWRTIGIPENPEGKETRLKINDRDQSLIRSSDGTELELDGHSRLLVI